MSLSSLTLFGFLGLSVGEWILCGLVVLVLFLAKKIPDFARGLGAGIHVFRQASKEVDMGKDLYKGDIGEGLVADALTVSNRTCEIQDPPELRPQTARQRMWDDFRLWLAQGFGIGQMPFAPGTFASLLGLLWFAVLIAWNSIPDYVLGTILGVAAAIWLCGEGEQILGRKAPRSVVLNEITALPVCFVTWVALSYVQSGTMPGVNVFFAQQLPQTMGVFVLFRLFFMLKPWPTRKLKALPGGWGMMLDGILAAACVNIIFLFKILFLG